MWSTEEEAHMRPGHFLICKFGTVPGSMRCVEKKWLSTVLHKTAFKLIFVDSLYSDTSKCPSRRGEEDEKFLRSRKLW